MTARARIRLRRKERREDFACLACGYVFDAASGIGETPPTRPTAGSISLCIRCGDLAVFLDGPPWLRPPTDEERRRCDADPDMARIRGLLRQFIAERSPS